MTVIFIKPRKRFAVWRYHVWILNLINKDQWPVWLIPASRQWRQLWSFQVTDREIVPGVYWPRTDRVDIFETELLSVRNVGPSWCWRNTSHKVCLGGEFSPGRQAVTESVGGTARQWRSDPWKLPSLSFTSFSRGIPVLSKPRSIPKHWEHFLKGYRVREHLDSTQS